MAIQSLRDIPDNAFDFSSFCNDANRSIMRQDPEDPYHLTDESGDYPQSPVNRAVAVLHSYEERNAFYRDEIRDFLKNDPSVDDCIQIVKMDGSLLGDIPDDKRTKDVLLTAVKQCGKAVAEIDNPDEDIQMAAVMEDGNALKYIEHPTDDVEMAAVTGRGQAVKYLKNPTEAKYLAAVSQNGRAISMIEDPSEAVKVAAVRQSGDAIGYIKNPEENICVESAAYWPWSIAAMKPESVTDKVFRTAIENVPSVVMVLGVDRFTPARSEQLKAIAKEYHPDIAWPDRTQRPVPEVEPNEADTQRQME